MPALVKSIGVEPIPNTVSIRMGIRRSRLAIPYALAKTILPSATSTTPEIPPRLPLYAAPNRLPTDSRTAFRRRLNGRESESQNADVTQTHVVPLFSRCARRRAQSERRITPLLTHGRGKHLSRRHKKNAASRCGCVVQFQPNVYDACARAGPLPFVRCHFPLDDASAN